MTAGPGHLPVGQKGGKTVRVMVCGAIWVALLTLGTLGVFNPTDSFAHRGQQRDRIVIDGGRVTMNVQEAPLREILREISQKALFPFAVEGETDRMVTREFASLSLGDALRRILRTNYIIVEDDATGVVRTVILLSEALGLDHIARASEQASVLDAEGVEPEAGDHIAGDEIDQMGEGAENAQSPPQSRGPPPFVPFDKDALALSVIEVLDGEDEER